MRIPDSLASLAEQGIIDEVLRPLMSGKEAQIYLLRVGDDQRVAKVYKKAQDRTFKHRAEYTEGRKVRNSRDQRAMAKQSRYGREQEEEAWRATEVDMIYRMRAAGVRVPTPYHFIDGVLIMELICDEDGNPAPRLGDVRLEREHAVQIYDQLVREVVRMLCGGVVHGDLSDFNVLLAPDGPVIIDFPQAVNASSGQNARKLLLRDVDNLHRFLMRFAPERRPLPYAEEMWQLYERGELTADARLSGRYRPAEGRVDTEGVLMAIADADSDERRRRARSGQSQRGAARPALDQSARSAGPIVERSVRSAGPAVDRNMRSSASVNDRSARSSAPVNDRNARSSASVNDRSMRSAAPVNDRSARGSPPVNDRNGRSSPPVNDRSARSSPPVNDRSIRSAAPVPSTQPVIGTSLTQPRKRRRRRRKPNTQ